MCVREHFFLPQKQLLFIIPITKNIQRWLPVNHKKMCVQELCAHISTQLGHTFVCLIKRIKLLFIIQFLKFFQRWLPVNRKKMCIQELCVHISTQLLDSHLFASSRENNKLLFNNSIGVIIIFLNEFNFLTLSFHANKIFWAVVYIRFQH